AVFMASGDGVPPALRRTISRFHSLPTTVVLLTVVLEPAPRVSDAQRVKNIVPLGKGFHRLTLHYGFIEEPDVHGDVAAALPRMGIPTPESELVYVIGRETFIAGGGGRMGAVSEGFFAFLSRNARSATDYFRLPPDQVVEVGAQIDL
ncbi:MAG TPA: KUP/HAK/KT family potassium transporter, partial [Polyangiaceae bacterium]